jgi:hypothetical protein
MTSIELAWMIVRDQNDYIHSTKLFIISVVIKFELSIFLIHGRLALPSNDQQTNQIRSLYHKTMANVPLKSISNNANGESVYFYV